MHNETLQAYFRLASYWLLGLVQAIPGGIKACVILISNKMPDESTDETTDKNTIQPPYRLTTCFSVISSLTPGQGVNDEFARAFKVLSK